MKENNKKINLLIIEDSPDDAQLLIRLLTKNQFIANYKIVENEAGLKMALNSTDWDLVISDYHLPQFNGIEAFRIFKRIGLDIPFIMVSGAIGEELAVEAMKEGIHDYVMKDNLDRLIPAIEREMKEARIRADKRNMEVQVMAEKLKFETLVNLSPFGLLIIMNNGEVKYMNGKINEFFGYHHKEIFTVADLITRIFPDIEENKWVREYWLYKFTPGSHSHETQFPPAICRDGSEKFISFKTGSIDALSYFMIIEDITIQRFAAQALEDNQKKLWQIIQAIDDIILEIRPDENEEYEIITANNAFYRTTGFLKENIHRKILMNIFPAGHKIFDLIRQVLEQQKTLVFEESLELNHRMLTWELSIAPVYDKNGKLQRIILSAHDLTERNKSEIRLRESESKFRLIASMASDAIWEWQINKDSIQWNEGLHSLFGYNMSEIEGNMKWVMQKIHSSDRKRFNETLDNAFEQTQDIINLEFKFECSDSTYKVVNSKVNIFYDQDGKPARLLGAMIDLTQRKKVEELRLQSLVEGADNERENIARELHDSLSQNLTLASILLQGYNDHPDEKNALSKIEQAGQIVTRVLNDTRDISHNLMPKTLDDFGLSASVENLVEHLGKGLNIKIITFFNIAEVRFPKSIEMNLFRIVQESLNNIIKHADATVVHISITKNNDSLMLMIEDNGKGFDIEKIRKRTGVGLKNLENRAIYLNGKFTLESKPGKGTLIMVEVPI